MRIRGKREREGGGDKNCGAKKGLSIRGNIVILKNGLGAKLLHRLCEGKKRERFNYLTCHLTYPSYPFPPFALPYPFSFSGLLLPIVPLSIAVFFIAIPKRKTNRSSAYRITKAPSFPGKTMPTF